MDADNDTPEVLIHDLVQASDSSVYAPLVDEYHRAEIALPDWAQPDQLCAAQQFFERWSLQLASSLFYASLPNAYAVEHGAKVLVATGQLADEQDLTRRIAETGHFLIEIFTPEYHEDGSAKTPLSPGTKSYRAARTVRLFHAAVRCWINSRSDADNAGIGVAISQEDLIGTLLSFTVAPFEAFDRMRVPYTAEGADAYLHMWCVIGSLLGIEDDCLPIERTEAHALAHLIADRHQGPSVEGRELTEALIEDGQGQLWPVIRKIPGALLYYLAGPKVGELHRVPKPSRWMIAGARGLSQLNRIVLRYSPNLSVNAWFGRRVLRYYIDRERGDRPPWAFADEIERQRGIPTKVGRQLRAMPRKLSGRGREVEPHTPPPDPPAHSN